MRLQVNAKTLKRIVDDLVAHSSGDEARPVLTNVLIEDTEQGFRLISTDSYGLYIADVPIEADDEVQDQRWGQFPKYEALVPADDPTPTSVKYRAAESKRLIAIIRAGRRGYIPDVIRVTVAGEGRGAKVSGGRGLTVQDLPWEAHIGYESAGQTEVSFTASYLARAFKAVPEGTLRLRGLKPASVESPDGATRVLLMPVRTPSDLGGAG